MPNWVCAGFSVTGDRTELERFRRLMITPTGQGGSADASAPAEPSVKGGRGAQPPEGRRLAFDFNGIVPMPPMGECPDPEAWAAENWGTKWNAQEVDVRIDDPDLVWFQFMTPWTFPARVFEALAREFPTLVLSGSAYEESGEFELVGEFNGKNDWGPGEIGWT